MYTLRRKNKSENHVLTFGFKKLFTEFILFSVRKLSKFSSLISFFSRKKHLQGITTVATQNLITIDGKKRVEEIERQGRVGSIAIPMLVIIGMY